MNRNTDYIKFAHPSIDKAEQKAVLQVLKSGWLTTGRVAKLFEKRFAEYLNIKHALAVNSGTAGLHLSLKALKIKPGSLVITTPYTFVATVEVIKYVGADPLFVDIEEETYNIDPFLVEKVLKRDGKSITAIIPVHIGGLPCNLEYLLNLAQHYEIPVIEDAAHAFPVKIKNKYLGSYGKIGVFSFYANKCLTTGEGGMVVTEDDDLAKQIRILRLHGIDRDVFDRYTASKVAWQYKVVNTGYKYNLTDLAAAIGVEQLKKAEYFLEKRRNIALQYINNLNKLDFIRVPKFSPNHAWHLFIIRIVQNKLAIDRDRFITELNNLGIGTSVHFIPLHIMPYYKGCYNFKEYDFPNALKNYKTSISLPIYPGLKKSEIHRIIEAIKKIGYAFYKS